MLLHLPKTLSASVLALTLFLFSDQPTFGQKPEKASASRFRFPEGRHNDHAELKHHEGVPILILQGTPEQMGTGAGKLALKGASKLRIFDYPNDALKLVAKKRRLPERILRAIMLANCKKLYQQFPSPYRTELEALSTASGIPEQLLMLGNTAFDLPTHGLGCSAILIDAKNSATGGVLFGRNLDFPSMGYLQEYSLVTVYRPEGKHAFATVGFPGLIGCISGMNDAGLCVAVHESYNARKGEKRFNTKGIPYALCYRKLLEECTTIEEAKKLLTSLPRTTWNNLSVADRNGVAVFEITPDTVEMRRGETGFTTCTNHFCTKLAGANNLNAVPDSEKRFELMTKQATDLLKAKKMDVKAVQGLLDAVAFNAPTLQTIQSMIFEPTTLKLHVALGKLPASKAKLVTLDLKELFGKR